MQINKTKILWISRFAPLSSASAGGSQTFNYYFKKFTGDSRFEIRLISCGFYKEKKSVEEENCNIPHSIIYWGDPSQSFICKTLNIESCINPWNRYASLLSNSDVIFIKKAIKKYICDGFIPDVVILEWTNMVMLAGYIKKVIPSAKIIASEHDVTFVGYKRKSQFFKGIKKIIWQQKYYHEKHLEIRNLKKCNLILPHNADNKSILENNGLITNRIHGLVPYYSNLASVERKPNNRDIIFFGAMARSENSLSAKWFIDNVMPLISDLDIRFVIVGSNPPEELKNLESTHIHITGFVDSVVPYFESAMCLVAPLVLGAGIKIKVLEALSSGITVLTNELGIEGIPAIDGIHYLHCESPKEYEKKIREIVNNKLDVETISIKAKEFIQNTFSVSKSAHEYMDEVIELGETR